jgi:hypothetical protein
MPRFHVKEIWRYPVKSMRGEQIDQCVVWEGGIPSILAGRFETNPGSKSLAPNGLPSF